MFQHRPDSRWFPRRAVTRLLLLAAFCALGAQPAVAQNAAGDKVPDAVAASPEHYSVKADNGRARLLEVRLPKGAKVPLHVHPERLIYVIQGGSLRTTDTAGQTSDITLTAGQALALRGETHTLENTGRKELVLLEIELGDTAALVPTLTTFERAELVAMLERSRDQLAEVIGRAQGERFTTRPAEGRWSVAEVVEHLATAEGMIFGLATAALATPEEPNWRNLHLATPVGGLMDRLIDRSQRFNAPEPLQPHGGKSRDELVAAFFGARAQTLDFVRATTAPLKAHAAQAPVGKMTAHQFLVLIAGHTMRHAAQAVEALAAVEAAAAGE